MLGSYCDIVLEAWISTESDTCSDLANFEEMER